ncbi:MAG: hypothetical protein M3P33_03545, partial [bacterium]|nr:hypothetical protein [bacterium]
DTSGNAIIAWEEQRDGVFNSTIWSQKLQGTDGAKLWPNGTQNTFALISDAGTHNRQSNSGTFRYQGTALSNGKVLIVGANGTSGGISVSELYDQVTKTISTGPTGRFTRASHTTAVLQNNKILIAGSSSNTIAGSISSAEEYDPVTNTFSTTASPMQYAREAATATTLRNGKVLVVGTLTANAGSSASEIYDPTTRTFSAGPIFRYARTRHSAILLPNGKVLLIGGDGAEARTAAELFDPIANTISVVTGANLIRTQSSATLLNNGKVLVSGGATSGSTISELYDPGTNTWSSVGGTSVPISRNENILLPNGKVLRAGGSDPADAVIYSSSELFDPATNTWSSGPNMTIDRKPNTSYLPISNQIYISGGKTSVTTSTAELYTPISDMPISQYDYRKQEIYQRSGQGSLNGLFFKKPKVTLDSNGDSVIAWQENKDDQVQFQGLSHAYDGNAYTQYGKNPASQGQSGGATPTILSPPVAIKAQMICASASCLDAGTTSGERQWGNDQDLINKNNPEDRPVSSINNSQNVNLVNDGANTVLAYDSDSGSASSTKTNTIYSQKTSSTGQAVWNTPWTATTGNMATNRRTFTSTLMNDGQVLITGGQNGSVLSSAALFNTTTGVGIATGNNMTTNHINHAASLLTDGKVLITGGGTSTTTSSTVTNIFNPVTNTFAVTTGGLVISRSDHTSTLLKNGKVLIYGGRNGATTVSSAELFTLSSSSFAATGTGVTGAHTNAQSALLSSGRVLISGGTNGTGPLSASEIYDPITATWSTSSFMTTKRNQFTLNLLPNGQVLAIGGTDGTNRLSSSEIYDPLKNSWTASGFMTLGLRSEHTTNLLPNGQLLIHGGTTNGTTELSTSEIYDPVTGTFTAMSNFSPNSRKDHKTTNLANGNLITLGGWDDTTTFSSAEILQINQNISSSNTNSRSPDLIKDSEGSFQLVWQSWKAEGLSPGVSSGSWKILTQKLNNPASSSVSKQYPSGTTGTWVSGANLNIPREKFTSAVLPSGKVLIAGGVTATEGSSTTAELYDPYANTWTLTGNSIPVAVQRAASMTVLTNGKAAVIGGEGNSNRTQLYDPSTNTWAAGGNMNIAREYFGNTITLNNGKVLVSGGYSSTSTTTATELYDPSTGTWSVVAGMRNAHYRHRSEKLNDGRVVVIGGCTSTTCTADVSTIVEIYNPDTNSWSTASGLGTARYEPNTNLLNNGKILVWGGQVSGGTALSTAEIFDPYLNSWTTTTSAPNTGYSGLEPSQSISLPSGKILTTRQTLGPSVYLYDPLMATWASTGSLSNSRPDSSPILLKNGKVLMAGGNNGGTLSTSELYTPELSEKLVSSDDSHLNTNQTEPKIASDSASGISYVTWNDDRLTSLTDTTRDSNIYIQKLNNEGSPVWPNGLGENGSYNVRDSRINHTRGSLDTSVQNNVSVARRVFTNTDSDIPLQLAWVSNSSSPSLSVFGQSFNTINNSMTSTSWTATYFTNAVSASNTMDIQVGAMEADGESASFLSTTGTFAGDNLSGSHSMVFNSLPPTGETSLTHKRLILKFTHKAGTGIIISYNGAAGVADTKLDVGTVVPERTLLLGFIIPFLPAMVYGYRKRILRNKLLSNQSTY